MRAHRMMGYETLWMPGAEANVGGANDTSMDLDSDYGDSVDRRRRASSAAR